VLGLWLAGCVGETGQAGQLEISQRRQVITAIRSYYELNAAEENNACSALIMSGISRVEMLSHSDGQLVVDVGYFYNNWAHRGSMQCRGFGQRQFTLVRSGDRFQVVDMTGERRRGARLRLW
jgi:hypothetical protein